MAGTRAAPASRPRPARVPGGPGWYPVPGTGRLALAIIGAGLTLLLVGHGLVPNWSGAGSAVDSVLPWLGLPLPLLFGFGLALRSRAGLAAFLAGAITWMVLFAPMLSQHPPGGPADLRLGTLNLDAANRDPAASLRRLAAAKADMLALQELTEHNRAVADQVLDGRYPYRAVEGTVGLWSRLPITVSRPVDIGIGWTRALRAVVPVAGAPVVVYVAHLASVRPAATAERDHTITTLARAIRADASAEVVLAGDLNTATTDRRFRLFAPLRDTQVQAGHGFGFTWPARLPVTRPDHILIRGLTAEHSWVVGVAGSDHRAALADLRLAPPGRR